MVARSLYVIKKDGRREVFQREKLLAGIRKACEKCPLPAGTLEQTVDEIESELFSLGWAEVPISRIGDLLMERLRRLDQIAYIRFASVYRRFADLAELKQEVEALSGPVGQLAQLPLLPQNPAPRRGVPKKV